MKKLLSKLKKVFFLIFITFLSLALSSFNSQEHKILADVGVSRVNWGSIVLPDEIKVLINSKSVYANDWRNAKMLAIGKDLLHPFIMSPCQDACYFGNYFGQLDKNKRNYIESEDYFPDNLLYIPAVVGANVEQFTFGDLVALYGDFRRTVYYMQSGDEYNGEIQCFLTGNDQNYNINFRGPIRKDNKNYCIPPITTGDYLHKIAFGLWPPFGIAGNYYSNTAKDNEYDNAGWWGDEMMRLANVNDTHFSSAAIAWYIGMHRLALQYVNKARTNPKYWIVAMHYEASALHTLTDLFCFGHVVTNRDQSSYAFMKYDNLLTNPSYLWMENVIKMGGGSRVTDEYRGKISLSSYLPDIKDIVNYRNDFMPSYTHFPPAGEKGLAPGAAVTEHDYHDRYNKSGATVRNINGDHFTVYGDERLRDLDQKSRRVIEDAVTASVQSLVDAYGSLNDNGGNINEIGETGSSYFKALRYIPVFIESDPYQHFTGSWTRYAEHVASVTGMQSIIPGDCKKCIIPFLFGGDNVLARIKITKPCCYFPYVKINNQVWMQRNLDVDHYQDGTKIPYVDPAKWGSLTTGAWCYYNNDPSNYAQYGKLYNWYAVNDKVHGGIAPAGWHIPNEDEWHTLINNLGGESNAGATMTGEKIPNIKTNNNSGFAALPGGMFNGSFTNINLQSNWWTSTERTPEPGKIYTIGSYGPVAIRMYYTSHKTGGIINEDLIGHVITSINVPGVGYSVRCVRGEF